MFYFLLFNITAIYAKLPETLFGIKVRSLDNEYMRLIFDQTLDNNAQKQISTQLSAVLICLDIESNLAPFDILASKISKLSKKTNKKYDNIEMRTKFEELLAEIEQKPNNNLGTIDICKFILKGVNYERSYDCNELESIGGGNPPIWWKEFEKHLSRKNFKYIEAKLELDFGSTQRDIWQWFGQHKIAGESELSHRIRMISARGDFDQIKAFKTVMELCLLKYHDMKVLEFQNPLTMAAEVLTEASFNSLFDAISYEQYFINLHSKNQFHMMFVEKFFIREKMKSIFQFIDEDKQILSKQFWGLFEVEQVSASASSESEIYLPKLYKECPPKLLSEHYGNIDNNDKSAFLIMHAYVQLMADVEDENSLKLSPPAKEQFQNVEIAVLLWVYNELIDAELFKFANSIEHRNADFVARIDAYAVKWDNLWIKNRQNDNNEMWCCELHKFAFEMVEDEALKQNVRWHEHVKSLVDRSTTLYEQKLVLLTPEKGGINWAQIDCTDNKIATKFMRSIKKVPNWLDQIHYYAITKLITKFVEFQCIFCYGKDHFSNLDMKERLSWIVSPNVFDAIEATFPEILNYAAIPDLGQLMSIAGAKTRLWKMTYKIKRPKTEIGVDSVFLKVWEDAGMDKNVFADSLLLPASYECLLTSELGNSLDKNAEMLKAEIAVFVQWMEDKLGLARRTIANKRLSRIWDKNKNFFNAIYDQIDDEDEHALALRSNQIRHFIYLLKQDLEMYKKMSELDERITDIFSNDLVQPIDAEEQRIYQKWMWHLHKCAVIRLIRNDTAFAERLKNANKSAKSKTAFKQSLIELVGETENVEEILKEFRNDRTEEIQKQTTILAICHLA
uniref:Uncharacterized protein n=1 Tax=Globodera rostochiensis TaxID=31243 RepID=A0A914IDM5_GLORO